MPLSAISKILAFQKVFIFAECQKWLFFMFTKSDATLRKQRSFWHYAIFLKLPDGPSFQVSFSDVTVAVSPHRLSKKCIKVRFFEHISGRYFWREKVYNSTNNSRSQNRDRRVILHKLCRFQPLLKFELSEKISWGSPFAKMQNMADFSCLRSRMLLSA